MLFGSRVNRGQNYDGRLDQWKITTNPSKSSAIMFSNEFFPQKSKF